MYDTRCLTGSHSSQNACTLGQKPSLEPQYSISLPFKQKKSCIQRHAATAAEQE